MSYEEEIFDPWNKILNICDDDEIDNKLNFYFILVSLLPNCLV